MEHVRRLLPGSLWGLPGPVNSSPFFFLPLPFFFPVACPSSLSVTTTISEESAGSFVATFVVLDVVRSWCCGGVVVITVGGGVVGGGDGGGGGVF